MRAYGWACRIASVLMFRPLDSQRIRRPMGNRVRGLLGRGVVERGRASCGAPMTPRELDAEFARKVLGWTDVRLYDGIWIGMPPGAASYNWLPYYYRSLDAAWSGRVALAARGWCCGTLESDYDYNWTFTLLHEGNDHIGQHEGTARGYSTDHPAHAVVLACLKAVGVEP
jgi:hypothetical protein